MADMRHVRAQLMRAAGHRLERQPGERARRRSPPPHNRSPRGSRPPRHGCAMRMNDFVLALLLGEKGRDAALPRLRHAGDQRPVDLARRARAERLRQRGRRKARLGDQQAAGGVLVEPVHQPRALAVRVAQHLEHAVDMARGAGAALHRKPHRLVEHQHVGVLVERDRFEERAGLLVGFVARRARLRRIEPQRRNAHRLAGLQPVLRLRRACR